MQKNAFLHENCVDAVSNPLKTHAHVQATLKLNISMIIYYSFRA